LASSGNTGGKAIEVIRVLLSDDHTLFRSGVASLLREQTDIEVIGEAQNGEEALEKSKELMPDVILMDIYMPGMGGLEATRRIKETLPYVKPTKRPGKAPPGESGPGCNVCPAPWPDLS
jgi:CheY-like chemotaxis protein